MRASRGEAGTGHGDDCRNAVCHRAWLRLCAEYGRRFQPSSAIRAGDFGGDGRCEWRKSRRFDWIALLSWRRDQSMAFQTAADELGGEYVCPLPAGAEAARYERSVSVLSCFAVKEARLRGD